MNQRDLAADRLAWSPAEFQNQTGLGKTTVAALIASGELPSVKIGRRRLILCQDAMNWLRAQSGQQAAA